MKFAGVIRILIFKIDNKLFNDMVSRYFSIGSCEIDCQNNEWLSAFVDALYGQYCLLQSFPPSFIRFSLWIRMLQISRTPFL